MQYKTKLVYLITLILTFNLIGEENVFAQKLLVLSFNIWDPNDVPFWEKHANGFPVDKVVNYLTEDKADILLLQEVCLENPPHKQALDEIKTKLGKDGYIYTAFYKPDYSTGRGSIGYVPGTKNSGYPLAIFSKYPILETYARQADQGKIMSKGVLAVKLNINNKDLYVFNTHLGIGVPGTNEEVNKVALPFVNQLANDELIIFGGDWNSPPATDFPDSSLKIGNYTYSTATTQFLLNDGFKDAWSELAKTKDIGNGVTCPGQNDYIKRVDQIYYRGKGLKTVNAFVKNNLWEYINLKDHIGVVVDFEL